MSNHITATDHDRARLRRIHQGARDTVMTADVDRWRAAGWMEPEPSWKLTPSGLVVIGAPGANMENSAPRSKFDEAWATPFEVPSGVGRREAILEKAELWGKAMSEHRHGDALAALDQLYAALGYGAMMTRAARSTDAAKPSPECPEHGTNRDGQGRMR